LSLDAAAPARPQHSSTDDFPVNLFEHWDSVEALEAWRAKAPRPSNEVGFSGVEGFEHEIARSGRPFD